MGCKSWRSRMGATKSGSTIWGKPRGPDVSPRIHRQFISPSQRGGSMKPCLNVVLFFPVGARFLASAASSNPSPPSATFQEKVRMKPKHLPRLWCALAGVLPLEGTGRPARLWVRPSVLFDPRSHTPADQRLRAEVERTDAPGRRSSLSS